MTTKKLAGVTIEPSETKIWRRWKWIGLAVYAAALLFNRWLPSLVVAAAYLYGIVVIANLVFHFARYVKNRMFWRVRNRLIGAFFFVGVIPMLFLAGVVFLTGYVLLGQMAGRLLEGSLHEVGNEITGINMELAGQLPPSEAPSVFQAKVPDILGDHKDHFPRMSARLLQRNAGGTFRQISAWDPQNIEGDSPKYQDKSWLDNEPYFEGIVAGSQSRLLMMSLQRVPRSNQLYVALAAPLDAAVQDRLQREKSIYFATLGGDHTKVSINGNNVNVQVDVRDGALQQQDANSLKQLEQRHAQDARRKVTWWITLEGRKYATGESDSIALAMLVVPIRTVLRYGIGSGDVQGKVLVGMIYVFGGMFVFVEVVSLVIGFTISRRITRSVHDMYQGTLALQKGDLQHRIPVRRKDQLGLLAHSFNQMSSSITRLLEEVSEKKRLEQELEIAREVQATLFPKQLPHPRGMMLFGGCEPARVVSGDYYDFILEDEARLDIVVADISGKGISAALLMANLQAAMRNQLLSIRNDNPEMIEQSLAGIMAHLNQQIYSNSPAEKYATLFLSRYDAESRRLFYCNAGHLPPILLDENGARLLEPTGMVVGLLPNATYEAKSVELAPGSMLAIFTDGVTEAVNKEDQEFGEERLLEVLKEARARTPEAVYKFVIERIRSWQGDLPQHDDITLIIAKAG
jgi:sigma-B regulation protein RsbU (phosphoserine phosphatase)